MVKLEDFTMKEASDYIINKIAEEKEIPKSLARKLFINSLLYNVVVEEIMGQVEFLMEAD